MHSKNIRLSQSLYEREENMTYTWMVLVDNKIVGYVKSKSEIDALRIAKDKIAKNCPFFIERAYLGNPIPTEKDFCFSAQNEHPDVNKFNW